MDIIQQWWTTIAVIILLGALAGGTWYWRSILATKLRSSAGRITRLQPLDNWALENGFRYSCLGLLALGWIWLLVSSPIWAVFFGLLVVAFALVAYALSLLDVCFTQIAEGTGITIKVGDSLDHYIMRWMGHFLHDPRRYWHRHTIPPWEVIRCADPRRQPSAYAWWQLHWWFLENFFGVYWFGLSPFKKIDWYTFDWGEPSHDASGKEVLRQRKELTKIVIVQPFTYWVKLVEAEDANNFQLDLEYLLTVRINNIHKARFHAQPSWLYRLTGDTNRSAKIWVGTHSYEEIRREASMTTPSGVASSPTSTHGGFVEIIRRVNYNLITDNLDIGAPKRIGVTVQAAALQNVSPSGAASRKILDATIAKGVAKAEAEAVIATAEGQKQAAILAAEGQKQSSILVAEGRSEAVELEYTAITKFSDGLTIRSLEAIEKSGAAGSNTVWANNPLGKLGDALADIGKKVNTLPPSSTP